MQSTLFFKTPLLSPSCAHFVKYVGNSTSLVTTPCQIAVFSFAMTSIFQPFSQDESFSTPNFLMGELINIKPVRIIRLAGLPTCKSGRWARISEADCCDPCQSPCSLSNVLQSLVQKIMISLIAPRRAIIIIPQSPTQFGIDPKPTKQWTGLSHSQCAGSHPS